MTNESVLARREAFLFANMNRLRHWAAACKIDDVITKSIYQDSALNIALAVDAPSEMFEEFIPFLSKGGALYGVYFHIITVALRNPACPMHVLRLGLDSPVKYYREGVLANPNCPEEWKVETFLKGSRQ